MKTGIFLITKLSTASKQKEEEGRRGTEDPSEIVPPKRKFHGASRRQRIAGFVETTPGQGSEEKLNIWKEGIIR